ncbi:MAG: 7-carboxy-7-deazaguanine synthase QueE [Halobacteriovoraceae bacterium]|nr:7-carboxy-7-deazaguanine synthase QueE [Halobacteriovoraceae bacterium]
MFQPMETMLAINSIYRATEGEGVNLGQTQVFVRFQGCNIGCYNCDSKDTWDFVEGGTMPLEKVIESVELQDIGKSKRVSITGGDPLHPKNSPGVLSLVRELKARGYWLNVEAAGTRVVPEIFDLVDFISFDYKTPSTGVKPNKNLFEKLNIQFKGKFQVKAVIETEEDFKSTLDFRNVVFPEGHTFPWCLTPCYNNEEEFPLERFNSVIEWNEKAGGPFRVIGQQHKWLHGPNKKQV